MGNLQSNDLVAGQVAAADAIMDDFTPEDLRKAMEEAVVPQAGILTLFAGFDPSLTKLQQLGLQLKMLLPSLGMTFDEYLAFIEELRAGTKTSQDLIDHMNARKERERVNNLAVIDARLQELSVQCDDPFEDAQRLHRIRAFECAREMWSQPDSQEFSFDNN